MINAQLELSFATRRRSAPPPTPRQPSFRTPQWWFQRMREIVDAALDWRPAPPPPEQIYLPGKDFRARAA